MRQGNVNSFLCAFFCFLPLKIVWAIKHVRAIDTQREVCETKRTVSAIVMCPQQYVVVVRRFDPNLHRNATRLKPKVNAIKNGRKPKQKQKHRKRDWKQNKHSANYIRARVCLTVWLTVCLSVYLSIPLSVCLPVCLLWVELCDCGWAYFKSQRKNNEQRQNLNNLLNKTERKNQKKR